MAIRVHYARAVYGREEIDAVLRVLRNPLSLVGGEFTKKFEERVSKVFNKRYGVMVNSGSSANLIAVELLGLPPGSEVITPVLTFSTTLAPIVQKGLRPVFVDVELGSYVVSVEQVEEAITGRTRALMIPLLLGNVPDMPKLWGIAEERGLFLVEDSCDTLGATINGVSTGSFSHISTTSFYASHVITACGGGGMLCVNDEEWARRARVLRGWGRASAVDERQTIDERLSYEIDGIRYDSKFAFEAIGYNFLPLEVSAAFGLVQLDRLPEFKRARQRNFNELLKFFRRYEKYFVLPKQREDVDTAWLAFPLTVRGDAPFTRSEIVRYLEERGIQTRPIMSGNILRHPGFRGVEHRKASEEFPVADEVMKQGFVVGIHHGLAPEDIEYMKEVFLDFLENRI